jgi:trigger factor
MSGLARCGDMKVLEMQITEVLNEGLKRGIKVTVPVKDMEQRLSEKLADATGKVRINGFRPGKVPVSHVRKLYGKSFMAELVNEIINSSAKSIPADRGEKAAMQPEIEMTEDEKEAGEILDGKKDFIFSVNYEVLPKIEIADISAIKVTRPIVEISDEEVESQVKIVADSARTFQTKTGKAANGDRVTINYLGKVDGEPFDGGKDEDAKLTLGSNQFIPGFEQQLVGVKAGDEKQISVTFPKDYGAANLAGKEATFDITVKEVSAADELVINDELAKKLGIESAERLRTVIREQIESQYGTQTRQKVKRQLLDALDAAYKFESPSKLIDAEFNNIWTQISRELEQAGRTFADEETTEEAAKEDYRKLAERRVRLGLVLSEIGQKAGVEVSEQELQRALYDQVRRYPGQESQIYEFFKNNPDAVAGLRAPIFEEKVVDQLLGQISVTDVVVTKEALMADDEEAGEAKAEKPKAKAKAKAKKADAE